MSGHRATAQVPLALRKGKDGNETRAAFDTPPISIRRLPARSGQLAYLQ